MIESDNACDQPVVANCSHLKIAGRPQLGCITLLTGYCRIAVSDNALP